MGMINDGFCPGFLASRFFRRREARGRLQNFGVLVQKRRHKSIIVEQPVAVVVRSVVKAWWSLQTVAVVASLFGTDGC